MTADPLDRIEEQNQPLKHLPNEHGLISRRELLALVEVARAARPFAAVPDGWLDGEEQWHKSKLREAVARLDKDAA